MWTPSRVQRIKEYLPHNLFIYSIAPRAEASPWAQRVTATWTVDWLLLSGVGWSKSKSTKSICSTNCWFTPQAWGPKQVHGYKEHRQHKLSIYSTAPRVEDLHHSMGRNFTTTPRVEISRAQRASQPELSTTLQAKANPWAQRAQQPELMMCSIALRVKVRSQHKEHTNIITNMDSIHLHQPTLAQALGLVKGNAQAVQQAGMLQGCEAQWKFGPNSYSNYFLLFSSKKHSFNISLITHKHCHEALFPFVIRSGTGRLSP